ncbi:MAG: hypothetical protein H6745_27250 [Deltaproteobacteria bacterium]|nr:hypothetical protein [Deltaproteobacteria bacterium]
MPPTPPDDGAGADEVRAPMAQMRSDVSRIAEVFRAIHSKYVWAGLAFYAVTTGVGVVIAVTTPLRDWFMHGLMYLAIFAFLMFYVRANQLHRRVARAFYAVAALGLIVFFAWALSDLVEGRLDVIEGLIATRDGRSIPGPVTAPRPDAPALMIPVVMLLLSALWLLFHWLVLVRYRRRDAHHRHR